MVYTLVSEEDLHPAAPWTWTDSGGLQSSERTSCASAQLLALLWYAVEFESLVAALRYSGGL